MPTHIPWQLAATLADYFAGAESLPRPPAAPDPPEDRPREPVPDGPRAAFPRAVEIFS